LNALPDGVRPDFTLPSALAVSAAATGKPTSIFIVPVAASQSR